MIVVLYLYTISFYLLFFFGLENFKKNSCNPRIYELVFRSTVHMPMSDIQWIAHDEINSACVFTNPFFLISWKMIAVNIRLEMSIGIM